MRSTPLSLGSGLALLAVLAALAPLGGCEETVPPVVPTTPVATSPEVTPPAAPVDLAPVPEPADMFVLARWKSPNATLSSLGSCSGVPQTLVDHRARHFLDRALASAFRSGVDGKQLADIIALDASVDMVVSLESGRRGQPDALFAFSVGLSSLERARSALEAAGPLVELQPGLWRVGSKGSSELSCAIGPAAGAAPARLICGTGDRDVSALGPYLARNVAVAAPPAQDVHAELRFVPIEARFGGDLRRLLTILPGAARTQAIGEPRFDHALDEAASALADEAKALSTDLDHLTFDLSVDGATCLTASGALQLRGKSSWIAGTIADRGAQVGPPPALFWRVPVDSDSASYNRGSDPAHYAGIFRVLRGLLEGKLAKEQIGSDADRKALAGLLNLPLGKDTNVVVASGHGTPGPRPAPTGGRPTDQQLAGEFAQSYLGWYLMGFDEGPAPLSKLLKDVVSVYGRKGLLDPARKALGRGGDSLPTIKLVPAPAQLGRGALDVEIHIDVKNKHADAPDPKKKKDAGAGINLHVLLMGEAHTTWIAVGANRDELVKRMLSSKGGAPDAGTLTARPGLEPLRNGKVLSSGFATVGMFTRGISNMLSSPLVQSAPSVSGPLGEIANTLNNLPHKGETPIFLTSSVTATGPRSEFSVNMQKGSLEDVGAILLTVNRILTNTGVLPP